MESTQKFLISLKVLSLYYSYFKLKSYCFHLRASMEIALFLIGNCYNSAYSFSVYQESLTSLK